MIGVWAAGLVMSLSAAVMFYRSMDDADTWLSAVAVTLGLVSAICGVVLCAGFVAIEAGIV